jgi:AraC-like DNA-binding protein
MVDSNQRDGVVWRLDLPESLPLIQADKVRLRQILLNLLSNSSKFTRQGEIVLGAEVDPPHLHLWVADTGAGIPPDDQEQIFEPFFSSEQLESRHEGIGLGLSITRRLVALHNGSMSLESQLGIGSTFHIYLPLPGLTGPSMPTMPESDSTVEAVLLLISHSPTPSPNILQLSQRQGLRIERITSINDVNLLYRPTVLAWDMKDAHPNDWELIAQLRRFPYLCRLPFVVYNQQPGSSGLTNVLVKPVAQATLIEMLESMRPAGDKNPILVVDDDPVVHEMLERLLTGAFSNLPIRFATDGQMALEMLTSFTPSLVILDLMMPRMDGFLFLEQLRKNVRWQSVPVLVMSGKLLSEEDVRRLDYAHVVFQSKQMLGPEETISKFRGLFDEKTHLAQATSALVKRALAYIHQNYALPLSREEIARAVGVSERYLSEIFKQEMGISPWDVLNRLRIQRACELLKTSDTSITEIAFQVGFSDSSYFGRVFSKQMGLSPKTYRQK